MQIPEQGSEVEWGEIRKSRTLNAAAGIRHRGCVGTYYRKGLVCIYSARDPKKEERAFGSSSAVTSFFVDIYLLISLSVHWHGRRCPCFHCCALSEGRQWEICQQEIAASFLHCIYIELVSF